MPPAGTNETRAPSRGLFDRLELRPPHDRVSSLSQVGEFFQPQRGVSMRQKDLFVICLVNLGIGVVGSVGCNGVAPQDTENVSQDATSVCAATVTKNVYDYKNWWGTITFVNKGATTSTNWSLSFDV